MDTAAAQLLKTKLLVQVIDNKLKDRATNNSSFKSDNEERDVACRLLTTNQNHMVVLSSQSHMTAVKKQNHSPQSTTSIDGNNY